MTKERLMKLLQRAVHAESFEIAVHPGAETDPERARYRWDYHWSDELAALVDPELRHQATNLGLRFGTYADLGAK